MVLYNPKRSKIIGAKVCIRSFETHFISDKNIPAETEITWKSVIINGIDIETYPIKVREKSAVAPSLPTANPIRSDFLNDEIALELSFFDSIMFAIATAVIISPPKTDKS